MRIDGRYRNRVVSPLAPSLAYNFADHIPNSWTNPHGIAERVTRAKARAGRGSATQHLP